jgi:hypothetical protein
MNESVDSKLSPPEGPLALGRRIWHCLPSRLRSILRLFGGCYLCFVLLLLGLASILQVRGCVHEKRVSRPLANFEYNVTSPVLEGVEIRFSHYEDDGGWGWKTSWIVFTAPAAVTDKLIQDHGLQPTQLKQETIDFMDRHSWRPVGDAFRKDSPRETGDPAYGRVLVRDPNSRRVWWYNGRLPMDGFSPSTTVPNF